MLLLKERLHDALHELCPENANEVLSKIYDRLPTLSGCSTITIDKEYVKNNLGSLVKDTDLSKFIL